MDTKDESPKLETDLQPVIPATPETAPALDTAASEATPPAGAVETETPPSPGILARISNAISRALSASPKRTGHALTMAMVIDTAGGQETFVAPSEISKLSAWQARHDKNLKFMLTGNPTADWLIHQKNVRDGIEADTSGALHALSRPEFEGAHQERIEAARLNLESIYQECFPLCSRIAARAIEIAEARTKAREQHERQEHEFYGVKFDGPSNIVRSFRASIQYARMRAAFVNTGGRASPRDIIGYINF